MVEPLFDYACSAHALCGLVGHFNAQRWEEIVGKIAVLPEGHELLALINLFDKFPTEMNTFNPALNDRLVRMANG